VSTQADRDIGSRTASPVIRPVQATCASFCRIEPSGFFDGPRLDDARTKRKLTRATVTPFPVSGIRADSPETGMVGLLR
jgi:hypothetical protein